MPTENDEQETPREPNIDPLNLSFKEELEEQVNLMEWPDRKALRLEQRAIEYGQVPIGIDCRRGIILQSEAGKEEKLNVLKGLREETDKILDQGNDLIDKIKESNEEADYQIDEDAVDFIRETQELFKSTIIPSLDEAIDEHS